MAERLARIRSHLTRSSDELHVIPCVSSFEKMEEVLSPSARVFLVGLFKEFFEDVRTLHVCRHERQLQLDKCKSIQDAFATCHFRNGPYGDGDAWTIDPLPDILRDRRVDIGDTSPAREVELVTALNSGAQGVQVDMDDGHCPSWRNVIEGHWNLMQAVRGNLKGLKSSPALLLVRPRAWNMDEENVMINGHVMPGALFDFGLESASEAALWAKIFSYSERVLGIPKRTIKATVLIEHILAAFEMDAILYELRHYSSGLNCGMWDYVASFLSKFRSFQEATVPDRQVFVSMRSPFLSNYMKLLIHTCKKRGAPATTGMVPFVLDTRNADLLTKIQSAKAYEANAGANGALVFDPSLVPVVQAIFDQAQPSNKPFVMPTREDLLILPRGNVTMHSITFNLRVVLAYIESWVNQNGIVILDGCVEDSATAEISRSQLWHWIKFSEPIHDTEEVVSMSVIHQVLTTLRTKYSPKAQALTLCVLQAERFPTFLTTFLYNQSLVWIKAFHATGGCVFDNLVVRGELLGSGAGLISFKSIK
ncbi:malate synthase [Thraustotheca clavata]|uniref:malate synthase n=1 Tax=Thraustotheca clavata TaxID=74557 RepID=A0A1W0A6J3_9STRA|nr:malate synthase [Thraustotheca clavata]